MADIKKGSLSLGLTAVQQATVEDQKGNIDEAVQLYSVALEHFQHASEEATDEKVKELIQKKCEMYIARMEHLRFIILKDQFPETPHREEEIIDLEKQFADIPVSDHGYNLNKQQQQIRSADSTPTRKTAPPDSPGEVLIETVEESARENTPTYATPELNKPSFLITEDDGAELVGPKDPAVVEAIDEAAKYIGQAKDEEAKGNMRASVALYKKGLTYLYRAYEKETDVRVKELVRIKYNVLVSRMEELESALGPPSDLKSGPLGSSLALIETYTTKARELADGFDYTQSIQYYNMAMAEIKKTMQREDVVAGKKWLAKRALVTERRIGGISAVVRIVSFVLPYPWSKLFGILEPLARATGFTQKAQVTIDKTLSKIAGVDYVEFNKDKDVAVDLSKDSKKGKKSLLGALLP